MHFLHFVISGQELQKQDIIDRTFGSTNDSSMRGDRVMSDALEKHRCYHHLLQTHRHAVIIL
jgi:hypothetical protein